MFENLVQSSEPHFRILLRDSEFQKRTKATELRRSVWLSNMDCYQMGDATLSVIGCLALVVFGG